MKQSVELLLYRQLTHWHSGVNLFSNIHNIQPVRTSKIRNCALNSVEQPDMSMCYRSAGSIQKHIWPNCNDDFTFDDTGFNGCIFGVLNLQPGCATPRSAIQGPSGTFVWRFLQARCREEYFSIQYVWCMWGKKIFVTRLLCSSRLGVMEEAGKVWKHAVSIVLYSVITWKLTEILNFSKSQKLILQAVIPRLAALRTF